MVSPRILDSLNSPLQLGVVPLGGSMGAVGFTICPGKWQSGAVSGEWQRNLELDLETIQQWGAAAVVTLMPAEELVSVQADGIGPACESRGMEWYHLPIRDGAIPDDHFERAWCYAGLRLRKHLRDGRHVLVHCRGGLGRSGVVAARLLVELGWQPEKAIKALRLQRSGAIETKAQEKYVRQLPSAVSTEADARANQIWGCILGGAVGDAFGYAIEFDRWPAIQRKYGSAGLQSPVLRDGQLIVSDDTQMTMFTLEALNLTLPTQGYVATENMLRPFMAACQHAYLRWGHTQGARIPDLYDDGPQAQLFRRPAMRHRRAPGNTCLAAVQKGALGTCYYPINDSKGCGAVMRTAPVGLVASASPELAFALGNVAGALTHGHIDGWLPAGMFAAMVRGLLAGSSLEVAAAQALSLSARVPQGGESATRRLVTEALRLTAVHASATSAHATLGEGWTGDEALAIAIYAVGVATDFENAMRIAANHDGDSDSTASIAGQLWGARDGVTSIPHAWLRRLDVLPEILVLVGDFIALENTPPAPWHR